MHPCLLSSYALLGDEMLALLGDEMFALLGDKMFALIATSLTSFTITTDEKALQNQRML